MARVTGQKKLNVAFADFSKTMHEELFKHIAITAHKINMNARTRAPVDSGRLQAGIRVTGPTRRSGKRSDSINARVTASAPYSAWVEFGSWQQKKRKIEFSMPPYSKGSFATWASRKGVPAFPVALGIKRGGGIKKRPFLGPAYVAAKGPYFSGVYRIIGVKVPAWISKKYG